MAYIYSMCLYVCHTDSRMWNKSTIYKYTQFLWCTILIIFYKTVIQIIFTHKQLICRVKGVYI